MTFSRIVRTRARQQWNDVKLIGHLPIFRKNSTYIRGIYSKRVFLIKCKCVHTQYTCKTIIYARELNNSPHTQTHLTYARIHVYKQHLAIYTICMCAEHAKRADILNTLEAILLRYSSAAYTPILSWSSNNVYSTYIQCNMYIYNIVYNILLFLSEQYECEKNTIRQVLLIITAWRCLHK